MRTNEKPEVGKAILFGFVALIAFYLCYFLLVTVIAFVFVLLLKIPLIGNLIEHLFRIRGDAPDIVTVLLAAGLSYSAIAWMIGRFCDDNPTERLTHYIAGGLITALSIILLVINIMNDSSFFPNIVCGIAGVIMIISGRE